LRGQALASGKRIFVEGLGALRFRLRVPAHQHLLPPAGPLRGPQRNSRHGRASAGPGDLWLASEANLCRLATGGAPPCRSIRVAGHEMTGTYADPAALTIVE
jgi:hypothetical protein